MMPATSPHQSYVSKKVERLLNGANRIYRNWTDYVERHTEDTAALERKILPLYDLSFCLATTEARMEKHEFQLALQAGVGSHAEALHQLDFTQKLHYKNTLLRMLIPCTESDVWLPHHFRQQTVSSLDWKELARAAYDRRTEELELSEGSTHCPLLEKTTKYLAAKEAVAAMIEYAEGQRIPFTPEQLTEKVEALFKKENAPLLTKGYESRMAAHQILMALVTASSQEILQENFRRHLELSTGSAVRLVQGLYAKNIPVLQRGISSVYDEIITEPTAEKAVPKTAALTRYLIKVFKNAQINIEKMVSELYAEARQERTRALQDSTGVRPTIEVGVARANSRVQRAQIRTHSYALLAAHLKEKRTGEFPIAVAGA